MSGVVGGLANTVASFVQAAYATVPTVNTQPTTYSLSIRAPGIAGLPVLTYSFPLSPQNIRKDVTALGSVYDVAGPASTNGVTRIVDQYGLTAPTFIIEGTTGWQRHNMDYFQYTGLQSINALEQTIESYISANQVLAAQGATDLYTLEFWDDFRGEYYQVEPIGNQGIRQSAAQPLLVYYSFRLVAVQEISQPIDDTERFLFSQVAAIEMRALMGAIGPVLSGY